MKPNLTPRAVVALSTAAASLFVLLCLWGYGRADAENARGALGLGDTIASWLVGPLGLGAHVIALLGLAWGVIVYFQERTPDLVLRLVGGVSLAASTAMVVGLASGGQGSWRAGSVGTAGANAMLALGTPGQILGWVVALALGFVSFWFATDSLFHTLRRGGRPQFDPRRLPTEPSRGDLLEDPSDAEPREFVPDASRAAEFVEEIEAQAPRPLELAVETLPTGFTAAPAGERTLVRGPQGYAGVEFLQTSDELAIPEPEEPPQDLPAFEDVVHEHVAFVDDEFVGSAAAPAVPPEPVAPPAVVLHEETPAEVQAPAQVEEPAEAFGIGLADESLLVDDVIAMPATFEDARDQPHDGASAAGEVVAHFEPSAPVAAAVAAVAEVPAPAAVAEETPEEPRFVDDVLVAGGASFDDDLLYVYDETPDAAPAPTSVAAAAHAAIEVAEELPAIALAQTVETEPTPDATTASVAITAEEIAEARATFVVEAPAEVAEIAEEAPVSVPVEPAEVASVLARSETSLPETFVEAEEELVIEEFPADEVAAPAAVAEISSDVAEVPAAEVVATAAETPAASAETPAAPAAPTSPQLALFPTPACDLSKLVSMDLDPLFHDAAQTILTRGRASAVVLQRALGIGYARGLRILDQMTAAGMLGPDSPGGAREICYTQADWDAAPK